jgi:hypothetical protein
MSTVEPRPLDLGVPDPADERVVAKGSKLAIDRYSDNTNPRRASGFFRKLEILSRCREEAQVNGNCLLRRRTIAHRFRLLVEKLPKKNLRPSMGAGKP